MTELIYSCPFLLMFKKWFNVHGFTKQIISERERGRDTNIYFEFIDIYGSLS